MLDRICIRAFALGISLVVLDVSAATLAEAQARVEERATIVATGDVTSVDAENRTITVKSTNDDGVVYQVDPAATIMAGNQDLTLDDVQVGWNIVVNGNRRGDTLLATYIKVVKKP